jgi:hypothetical protein
MLISSQYCPCCGEILVHANIGDGTVDIYCEECGWPDECLDPNPACVICGQPGVGICADTWRCEDHWLDKA